MNSNIHVSPAALSALREELHGELALPGDRDYALTRPWNAALTTQPAAVVAAADVFDVQHAVKWAAAQRLRVAVHATGHGGVGQGSDVLVVHTGRLQQCSIDVERRSAHFGAGVNAEQLLNAAHEFGLAPVIGSTGTVGVAGYLSGGGIGPLVSTFGLSSDYVRALEVVIADGTVQRVSWDENPDLYWAMRGAKGALGIITAVELELLDLPAVYGGALNFAACHAGDVVREWARWSAQLPEMATTSLALVNMPDDPYAPASLAGHFIASLRFATPTGKDDAEALLADIRQVAPPVVDTIGMMPYRNLSTAWGNAAGPAPVHQNQVLLTALTPETVESVLRATGPDSGSGLVEVELRRLGGALARQPRHTSAFSHREHPYSLGITGILTGESSSTVASAQRLLAAVRPWSAEATMANFIDAVDATTVARSYDRHTLARLRDIAGKYDPAGVFTVAGELDLVRNRLELH